MAGVTGREVAMAFAKFGTNSWGVAASVTKGMYFSSDGGIKLQPNIILDDAMGQRFLKQSDVANITPPAPKLAARVRFDDSSYIWEALAMGSPAAVTIATSAAGQVTSWRHQLDLAANIDGLGLTVAMDKQRYVEELTSAKVHGWTLENGEGGLMQQTYNVTGSKVTNISSTNINSTVGGATYPSLANRVLMKQGVFRMNANAGGSLVAADAVQAESIKFTFDRPQDAPFIFGQDYIAEPADNGFPTFSLEVMYPRMTTTSANSLFHAHANGTTLKGDLTFTGQNINSTDAYSLLYQFPLLQCTEFEAPVTGANQVKPKAKFELRLADAAPTGMAGLTNPFRIVRVMTNSLVAF